MSTTRDVGAEFRAWLEINVSTDWRARVRSGEDDLISVQRSWMRRLNAGGWAAPKWPREFGGVGATLAEQMAMTHEAERADAPPTSAFEAGLNHTGATLIAHGTDEQRRHLPEVLNGNVIWCQGFSEPDAGSDLAALKTRAVRDGDHYVVNGQKVWSSGAHHADWCLLLARTDAQVRQHDGISYFLLDLRTPGVEVRPLRQITGEAEFCEIFLDDVAIPVGNVVGREGDGWRISMTTLQTERGAFLLRRSRALQQRVARVIAQAGSSTSSGTTPMIDSPHVRQQLAADYAETEILAELSQRVLSKELSFGHAGSEPSIAKLFEADLTLRIGAHSLEILGLNGQIDAPATASADGEPTWLVDHLHTLQLRIAGGTSEIQRNIVGERVLGLPREPRPGREV